MNDPPLIWILYFSPMAIVFVFVFVITNLSVGGFGGTDARRTLFAGAALAATGTALSYAACVLVRRHHRRKAEPDAASGS